MPAMGGERQETGSAKSEIVQAPGECASDEALARAMQEQEWYEAQQDHRLHVCVCMCVYLCARVVRGPATPQAT